MSEPQDEHAPLWPPLLLTLGVLYVATEARHAKLALTALAALVLLPTAWRVMTRRWVRGDVMRGLGAGYIASHVPLLLGACSTLERPECRIHLCMEGVVAGVPFVPWAGVLGTLLYWAWAGPGPGRRAE
ncbi:hypothetical protein JRI60_45010 [Archangium violaceum]|jgi:hypothetical protein|uniref:hypothetical protein n=1 Tax=Archangium violaceum TaxID=83451 RepID=UPI00194F297A|nr:hypothetical protein [Archangium violaceum]QRN96115.1 hypothetical protein JRI60_45010 [Archangium violaceum]